MNTPFFPTAMVRCVRACGPAARRCIAVLLLVGTAASAADVPAPPLSEVGPELFYMEDDGGRLVPVPGFRFRDFIDLLRMKEGVAGPAQPPAAVLENVVVKIDTRGIAQQAAQGGPVTCPANVTCTVRQTRGGWASVPLELGDLLLSGPARHEGPGRMIVDAEPERAGYRAWFDAAAAPPADARHTVILEGRLPIDVTALHESFVIRLPAAVASLLEVQTSRSAPQVSVQPAAPEEKILAADGGSLVTLAGLGGAVRVRIGERGGPRVGIDPSPRATVESVVRVDGRNALTEAVVRLEGLGPGTDRVRIALPPRATLGGVRAPASVVGQGGSAEEPFVDVAIDRDADGDATIGIQCQRPVDPSGAAPFESLGFAVQGIEPWRQWGRVSVLADGDWQVSWGDTPGPRRVDPPVSARRPGFVAAFAYDAQPASLPLTVRPRGSRVVIEPEYRYEVGGTTITMQARLRIAARGAPVGSVAMTIDPAWEVDEAGPAGIVDATALAVEDGRLVIPFAQPLAGDTVVELRCVRAIDRRDERLTWQLPVPRADLVGPASVVISADSDIELLPDAEGMRGLVRQTGPRSPVGAGDRNTLAYRLDAAQGTFSATRRFLPRRVEAALSVRASIDVAEMSVEETTRLTVMHVPLESIEIVVAAEVLASGTLEIRQEGMLLEPLVIDSPAAARGAPEHEGLECVQVLLEAPLLGTGELTIRYRVPTPVVPAEATVAVDLPLALPLAAGIVRQTVELGAPESLAVAVRGDAWRRDVGLLPAVAATAWSAAKPQHLLPLSLASRRAAEARVTVIEAAWLRTRLLPDGREDVFTCCLSGAAERLAVTLPVIPEGGAGTYEVRLDGLVQPDALRGDGHALISLADAHGADRHLLEIRTTTPRAGGWMEQVARLGLPLTVRLAAPVFEDGVLQRRFYWSIHARADEHLLGMPSRWTAQQRWQWGTTGWQREPVVSAGELADWVRGMVARPQADSAAGAPQRPAALGLDPRLAESTWVFSGLGAPGTARCWLVPTWLLVLVASGTALAAGLTVVYRPWFRRVPVVLTLLAVACLVAAAWPDQAPLAVQSALPGMLLALLAWALKSLTERPAPVRSVSGMQASSLARSEPSTPSLLVGSGRGPVAAGDAATAAGRVTP